MYTNSSYKHLYSFPYKVETQCIFFALNGCRVCTIKMTEVIERKPTDINQWKSISKNVNCTSLLYVFQCEIMYVQSSPERGFR